MDSLTQLALGAAVGHATLGRHVGRRALLWGAVCGTLPDLDALIPFGNAVADLTYHRAASHSLFFLTLATPFIAWIITRIHPSTKRYWLGWIALVWLALATHALLDSFTIYGTQLWLPFSNTPIGWGTIFIIDPLYTLPLLLGVLAAALIRRPARLGYRLNALGLVVSSFYLAFTVMAKLHVDAVVAAEVSRQNLPGQRTLSLPAPLNALLWRVLVMDDSRYYEGFYSLLDDSRHIQFASYPSRPDLLAPLVHDWAVQRLRWFTKGFYSVTLEGADVSITDLRMGQEPYYVFSFRVGERRGGRIIPAPVARKSPGKPPRSALLVTMERIWNPSACVTSQPLAVTLSCRER